MKICSVRCIRLCSLCLVACIVLLFVGCSVSTIPVNDSNDVDQSSTSSMKNSVSIALYVTENSPPTPLPTAEPPTETDQFEFDPAVIARFPVVYNAMLYAQPHPISEYERLGYYMPVEQTAAVLGVSADGVWLLVRHPAGVDGWVETDRLDVSAVALRQLMANTLPIAELIPTPTLFPVPPTAAPVVLNESPVIVQSDVIEPPAATATPESEPQVIQSAPPSADVPPPVVTTFADGTSDIVRMTANQDAAIFAQSSPSTSPEDRTGYFVPAGQSVYAVGLAEDRYWVHVVYQDAVQGWVSPHYFTLTSGDLGMLPSSDYRLVRGSEAEAESQSVWRLPYPPEYSE